MRLRDGLLGGLLLLTAACGASDASSDAETEDALGGTKTEQAMAAVCGDAKTVLFANVKGSASTTLSSALITAAKRGVDVHVVLTPTSFDGSWMLQQHLESSGVDVDVRTDDPVSGALVVTDDEALLASGTTSTKRDDGNAQSLAEAFTRVLAFDGAPSAAPKLARSGSVAVRPMPETSRGRVVDLFSAAKTSIDLEIYQLQERAVVSSLKSAAARGVTVRVMLEPRTVGAANYDAVSKELTAAGISVQATPPAFDSSHNVDHAKFAVLDGKELLFGTGNLVRSGLGGATETAYDNRDFWVEDARASVVAEAKQLFEADWARTPTSTLTFANLVLTPDNADARITALIDAAKTRLYVYNQSLTDDDLVERLLAAKSRGVDVQVLLGYQPGFGGQPPQNQAALDRLTAAGIKAAYLRLHYLHAKGIVSDGSVYLGSQNFTNGGLRNNRELGEILDSPGVVDAVARTFADDLAKSLEPATP